MLQSFGTSCEIVKLTTVCIINLSQGASSYGMEACALEQKAPRDSWLQRQEVEAAAAAEGLVNWQVRFMGVNQYGVCGLFTFAYALVCDRTRLQWV